MILSNVSDEAILDHKHAARKSDEIVFDCVDTEIQWIKSLLVLHESKKNKLRAAILLISQMWKYKDAQIEDPWLIHMLELANKETSFILWSSTDFVNMMPIAQYRHRGLQISEKVRRNYKWIWTDLLHAHNRINDHPKEITMVPSILLLYIKNWYKITGIYTPNVETYTKFESWNKKAKYIWYSLDAFEEQNRVYNIILEFLKSGDIWLPFFVQLEKEENNTNYWESDIVWMKDVFEELIAVWRDTGDNGTYPIVNRKFRSDILKVIWLKPKLKDWLNK